MTDYALVGLTNRRAALAGEIDALHRQLGVLLTNLETLDNAILQFDPSHRVEAIRPKAFRPPGDWSKKGQMARMVLSVLRQAAEPLTSRDVAMEVLVGRALDRRDVALLRAMTKRVSIALRNQRDNGTVRAIEGPGQLLLWEVAR